MKNFLRRLKREVPIYIMSCLIIAIFAAWLFLFYNPLQYRASARLILTDAGRAFLIKEGLLENPAKISQYKNVEFNISSGSKILEITATGENPSEIARRVNIIAEKYKSEIDKGGLAVLLKKQSRQLEKIDKSYGEHRKTSVKIINELEELEVKMKSLKRKHDTVEGTANSLKNRISDLEMQRENLLRVYTESHPDVQGIDYELNSLRKKLANLPAVKGLEPLTRSVNEKRAEYKNIQGKIAKLGQQKTNLITRGKRSLADIKSYASRPTIPVGDMGAGDIYKRFIFYGFLIGLSASLIVAALKDTVVSGLEISNIPELPLLATVPFVKPKKKQQKGIQYGPKSIGTHLLFYYDSSSDYVDAYRALATHIKLDAFKGYLDKKVMLFTSPEDKAGRSTVCANLAITLARSGKRVILLDANLNRRSVARFFGIGAKVIGISDIVSGKEKLQDCIKDITDLLIGGEISWDIVMKAYGLDRLKILPSGMKVINFADLLEAEEMARLFKQLREQFDCVIVDSPGLLRSPDSLVLSSNADGIFLVCRRGRTSYKDIVTCSKSLAEAKTQFKGIVLVCT